MQYRTLGRTGLKVSPLGLGTSNFGDVTPEDEARRIIERTLDSGVNLIDLGHIYGDGRAERIVGSVLKETGRRHEVVISTKVYPGQFDEQTGLARLEHVPGRNPDEQGLSRAGILNACDAALRRLQTDHIDLYRPTARTSASRSTRRCARSTTWSGPARSCPSAARRIPPGA